MHHSNAADHVRHDPSLIAGHAAGDLPASDRHVVEALLSTCSPCAELHQDLVTIAAATRSLPAPFTPARDFRLDPAQAERLRRGSWLRAALRPFSAAHSAVRPMAAAFTSLGLAGLLVATVIPSLLGSPASAPGAAQREDLGVASASGVAAASAAAPASSAAAVVQAGSTHDRLGPVAAAPSQRTGYENSSTDDMYAGGKSSPGASTAPRAAAGGEATPASDAGVVTVTAPLNEVPVVGSLIAGSLGLLAVGLLLFGLRFAGRRLR